MGRFLVDIPEDDVRRLDELARREGKSRTGVIRDAVAQFIAESGKDWLEAGFGLWARHGIAIDPQEYERKRRAEWTRPWDEDFEEVRAESPDCFDDYDVRERAHFLALQAKAGAGRKKNRKKNAA